MKPEPHFQIGSRFRLPFRPRFVHELVIVPMEDGVMIDGAGQPHILEGPGFHTLLPKLIPQLDGIHTLDEIHRELPDIPAGDLHEVIAWLASLGLVEDMPANDVTRGNNNPTLEFFRRRFGTTGVHSSGWQAYKALQAAEVLLLSSGQNLSEMNTLRSLLEQSGAKVTILPRESLAAHSRPKSFIVSACFTGEDVRAHTSLDQWRIDNGGSWLRAVLDIEKNYADLGPFFNSYSACYQCFYKVHGRSNASHSPLAVKDSPDLNAEFLLSLLAMEIICILSSIGPSLTERGFQRYDLQQRNSQRLRCFRVPGCPVCRPRPAVKSLVSLYSEQIDTAVVFEDYVGLPFRANVPARIEQDLFQIGAELGREFTRLSNCPCIPLPRPRLVAGPHAAEDRASPECPNSQVTTMDDLALLLLMTAGIRDRQSEGTPRRWAATAGNLGSVELFLIVHRVSGLEPGIYFYQSDDHSLAHFEPHQGIRKISALMQGITLTESENLPDLLVVFTGAFHKVAPKYAHFGYRLLNFDAGVALDQLHFTADCLNLNSLTITRWADDIIEQQLNLSRMRKQVTALVSVSGVPSAQFVSPQFPSSSQTDRSIVAMQPGSTKQVREFSEQPLEKIFELLVNESRLPEDLLAGPFESTSHFKEMVPLPPPGKFDTASLELFNRRKSIRHYSSDALSSFQLSSMLHMAHERDMRDWPEEHAAGLALSFVVLARRVAGLEFGAYVYAPHNHALGLINDKFTQQEMLQFFVQSEFAFSPIVIWIAGNLAAACARYGAFGHRQLLLRAGAAANRLWLAALEMGLAGCIVAGLVPGEARTRLGFDGYLRASLIAFAAGCELNPNP